MGLEPTAFQLGTGCAIQLRHAGFYVWLDSNQLHNYAAEGCLTAPAFQQRVHTLNSLLCLAKDNNTQLDLNQ